MDLLIDPTFCIEPLHLMGLEHVSQVALLPLSTEASEPLALFQGSLFESELDLGLSVPCAIHHLLPLEAIVRGTSVAWVVILALQEVAFLVDKLRLVRPVRVHGSFFLRTLDLARVTLILLLRVVLHL